MSKIDLKSPAFGIDTGVAEAIKLSITNTVYYTKPIVRPDGSTSKGVYCKINFVIKGPEDVLSVVDMFADADCYEAVGQATVNPDDNFDYHTGMKIARAKAESLAYAKVDRLFRRVSGHLANVAIHFLNFQTKSASVIEHNNKYLSKF